MAADYQVVFGGFTIGDLTEYDIVDITGLEGLEVRSNDVVRPSGWGAIAQAAFVNPKVIDIEVECPADSTLIRALEAAFTPPALDAPAALVTTTIKFPGREEWQLKTRCARRGRSRNIQSELGLTTIVIQLEAPDPRLYSSTLSQASSPAFVVDGGGLELTAGSGANLGTDLTVDSGAALGVDLSAVVGSGLVTVINTGTVATFPTVTFTAPAGMSQFRLSNLTTGEVADFVQTVNPGEAFIVDWTPDAALPVSIGGASRYSSWQAPRVALRIVPGSNLFRFDVFVGVASGAQALVQWRSAEI
jgi:hypothetical protein